MKDSSTYPCPNMTSGRVGGSEEFWCDKCAYCDSQGCSVVEDCWASFRALYGKEVKDEIPESEVPVGSSGSGL